VTHSIRYWDARITRRGVCENDDPVLDYYHLQYSVDKLWFGRTLTITALKHQLNNVRNQLKDVLKDAKSNWSFYEVEVATARVEKKFLHLTEDNTACAIECDDKIQLEKKRANT
jgi:hypothetical protein